MVYNQESWLVVSDIWTSRKGVMAMADGARIQQKSAPVMEGLATFEEARHVGRVGLCGEDHRVIEHHILKKHLSMQSSKSSILYFYLVPCSSLLIFALWRPCETQLLIRRRHCKTPGKRARAPRALDDFNGRSHFFLWHPGII
jgi:hypothetical protein